MPALNIDVPGIKRLQTVLPKITSEEAQQIFIPMQLGSVVAGAKITRTFLLPYGPVFVLEANGNQMLIDELRQELVTGLGNLMAKEQGKLVYYWSTGVDMPTFGQMVTVLGEEVITKVVEAFGINSQGDHYQIFRTIQDQLGLPNLTYQRRKEEFDKPCRSFIDAEYRLMIALVQRLNLLYLCKMEGQTITDEHLIR
jgi:hypothetical protein